MPFAKNDPNINRKGRPPKGQSWAELIRETGELIDPESQKQFKTLVIEQLYSKAIKGDISAIREIIDRTDGKATNTPYFPTQAPEVDVKDPHVLRTLLLTAAAVEEAEFKNQKNL